MPFTAHINMANEFLVMFTTCIKTGIKVFKASSIVAYLQVSGNQFSDDLMPSPICNP